LSDIDFEKWEPVTGWDGINMGGDKKFVSPAVYRYAKWAHDRLEGSRKNARELESLRNQLEDARDNQCLICETPADHDQRLCVAKLGRLTEAMDSAYNLMIEGNPDEAFAALRRVVGRQTEPRSVT